MRYFITLYNSFIEIYYCFHIISHVIMTNINVPNVHDGAICMQSITTKIIAETCRSFYESMNRWVISNLETLNFSVRSLVFAHTQRTWRNMLCMTATSLLCTKAARWGCQWMGYVACVRHAQYVSLFMQRARRVWLSRVQFLPIFLFVFLGTHNNTDDNKTTPPSLNFKQNRRHK